MKDSIRHTYCSFCLNRNNDSINGLICGLTNSKANFEITCENFKKDMEELEKARMGSKHYRMFDYNDSKYLYPYLSKSDEPNFKNDELILFKNVFLSIWFKFILVFSLTFIPIILFISNASLIHISIISLSILLMGTLRLHLKIKQKPLLKIDKNGFLLKNKQQIMWENIIRYYFKVYVDNSSDYFSNTSEILTIEIFGKDDPILLDLSSCAIDLYELGRSIEKIRKDSEK